MAEWSRQTVAKNCNVMHSEISDAVKNGDIKPLRGRGKSEVFDSAEVTEFFGGHSGNHETAETAANRELVKAFNATLGQVKDLVRIVIEPRDVVLDMLRAENLSLRERAEKSDERMVDLIEAYEAMLDRKSERELNQQIWADKAKMRAETLQTLLAITPVVVEQAMGLHSVRVALESLTDEQIAFLRASNLLSPEQLAWLQNLVNERRKEDERRRQQGSNAGPGPDGSKAASRGRGRRRGKAAPSPGRGTPESNGRSSSKASDGGA